MVFQDVIIKRCAKPLSSVRGAFQEVWGVKKGHDFLQQEGFSSATEA